MKRAIAVTASTGGPSSSAEANVVDAQGVGLDGSRAPSTGENQNRLPSTGDSCGAHPAPAPARARPRREPASPSEGGAKALHRARSRNSNVAPPSSMWDVLPHIDGSSVRNLGTSVLGPAINNATAGNETVGQGTASNGTSPDTDPLSFESSEPPSPVVVRSVDEALRICRRESDRVSRSVCNSVNVYCHDAEAAVGHGLSNAVTAIENAKQEEGLRDEVRKLKLQLQQMQAGLAATVQAEVQAQLQKAQESSAPSRVMTNASQDRKRQRRTSLHAAVDLAKDLNPFQNRAWEERSVHWEHSVWIAPLLIGLEPIRGLASYFLVFLLMINLAVQVRNRTHPVHLIMRTYHCTHRCHVWY